MKRLIEDKLLNWYKKENHKPLIVKGARQVGKTYSIRKFASTYYDYTVEINFERETEYLELFKQTRNPKDILDFLKLSYFDVPFDRKTLLFLDEIQASSEAITSLKFLAEDFPCDIICSGSALGVAIAATSSFPVGYVESINMYPMTFLEYLYAKGLPTELLENLKQAFLSKTPLSNVIHEKMNEIFKEYVIVGGMPEVVKLYINTQSTRDILELQRRIISDYKNDMNKYALKTDRIKTRECFESLPLQLAKDNKKFQYKLAKKGYNARYFESSLQWLLDGGLIFKTNRLSTIQKPLEAHKELQNFKVYMADTGLLVSQFDEADIKDIVTGSLGIYNGALFENVIAQLLNTYGKQNYYYINNQYHEIDFIIYYKGNITPMEIKSSTNKKSISFNNFYQSESFKQGFRISMNNFGFNQVDNIYYLPFYLLEFALIDETNGY